MFDLKDFNLFVKKNNKKSVFSALKKIHGINWYCLNRILIISGIEKHLKVNELTSKEFGVLKSQVAFFYNLEENKIYNKVEEKKQVKSYSGMRHLLKLPVRGQRTHSNADTSRRNIKKEM